VRVVIVFALISSLGCANYPVARKAARVGGNLMLVAMPIAAVGGGIVLTNRGDEGAGYLVFGIEVLALAIFSAGLITGSVGLIGMRMHDEHALPVRSEVFCTTSPVALSVCFCSVRRTECEARRHEIEVGGGSMNACVVELEDRCGSR